MSESSISSSWEALGALMARLRDLVAGCPWDRRQTFATMAPYTLEEAYEVLEAIARGDMEELREELGDLLFQVIFHARMAEEAGHFDLQDVVRGLVEKMVRRHPHVFGELRHQDEADRQAAWEAQKTLERERKRPSDQPSSALDGVALALPALTRAVKLQKWAAREGFDWPNTDAMWLKIDEELAELRAGLAAGDAANIEEEVGDVLFAITNLARKLGVDPEAALRGCNAKFERRYRSMETVAAARGLRLADLTLEEQEAIYREVKQRGA
ncbi:MAG: nucleoside triphosphate pyrophosphohydrolase [Halothiobacillaceae bacterium]